MDTTRRIQAAVAQTDLVVVALMRTLVVIIVLTAILLVAVIAARFFCCRHYDPYFIDYEVDDFDMTSEGDD